MSLTVIGILIVLGLLFILIEILVIPGTTFVGIIGTLLMGVGLWGTFSLYGKTVGIISTISTVTLTLIVFYYSFKGKTWKSMALKKSIDSKIITVDEEKVKVGDTGKTISRLAPIGKALINNESYEVKSLGEFIDEDIEITVTKVERNSIYVIKK